MANALHKEIADELREKIRSGEFAAGRRLPTEPELERLFGASRNTIRIAVTTLVHEGLIQIQPGRGMFVPEGPIPFFVILSREEGGDGTGSALDSYSSGVRAAGRKPSIRDFETRIEYPDREVAGWLQIDEDTQVVVRGSKRFIDDTPYSLQKSYYSMKLVRGTELEGKEKIARGRSGRSPRWATSSPGTGTNSSRGCPPRRRRGSSRSGPVSPSSWCTASPTPVRPCRSA
jgi:GntR family transcriptional regulator